MKTSSIGVMSLLNCLGAIVGVGQSIAIAYFFGATRQVEIFFAAVAIETSVVRLTQTGQLTEIFLPQYHRLKHDDGAQHAHACFAVMINILLIAGALLACVLYLTAPYLVALRVPGFTDADILTTTSLFRALLPLLLIHVLAAMLRTLANAEKWFGAPEAISIAGRLLGVCLLVACAASWGTWALVAALYLSNGITLVAMAVIALRLGYRHHFRLREAGFRPLPLLRQLSTTFVYVIATQAYAFAFDAGLSQLPQGVFAVFKYVQQQLVGKTMVLILRPVNIVFYTHVAELLAQGSREVKALTRRALDLSFAGWVLAVSAFTAAGTPLLHGLWWGESFDEDGIQLAVQLALLLYVLLIATATGQVYRRLAMSLGYVRGYYIAASGVQIVSGLLSLFFLPHYGTAGAFAVVAINMIALACVPLILVILSRIDLATFFSPMEVARWILAAAIGTSLAVALGRIESIEALATGRAGQLSVAVMLAAASVLGTLTFACWFGVVEVRRTLSKLRIAISRASSTGHG